LVNEQERIEQVCNKCADEFLDVEAGPEQDFDESLVWAGYDGENDE
jgi:hypothetical protein